jgi:hypothetical protein
MELLFFLSLSLSLPHFFLHKLFKINFYIAINAITRFENIYNAQPKLYTYIVMVDDIKQIISNHKYIEIVRENK